MITIEETEVFGWEAAIRGARNPLNSWKKSDSMYDDYEGEYIIGPSDLDLMQRLSKAGTDHGKFLRFITVNCDITAPFYWWKQFDTYKVGTVANSCSTMHKIHAKEFTFGDFSTEHMDDEGLASMTQTIKLLNKYRERYNDTQDKDAWYSMVQLLPNCYNQKRTVMMNYQVVKSMYSARKSHKLKEWHVFCEWAETLPKFKELCL